MTPPSATNNIENPILAAPSALCAEQLDIPVLAPAELGILEDVILEFPPELEADIADATHYLLYSLQLNSASTNKQLDAIFSYLQSRDKNEITALYAIYYFLHALRALEETKANLCEKKSLTDCGELKESALRFETAYKAICRVLGASEIIEHFDALYATYWPNKATSVA